MKLRRAGWLIRFAPHARALTRVPETMPALIGQRLRWDRALVAIWLRKFRGELDFRQSTFRLRDAAVLLDILVFQVLLALAFPAYLIWLWTYLGDFSANIVGATLAGYVLLDLLTFAAAVTVGVAVSPRLLLYLPVYTALQFSVIRVVRLIAIVQELVFRSSYRDPFVPARVMQQVERI